MEIIDIILLTKRNLFWGVFVKVLLTTIFLLFPSFLFGDWTRVGSGKYYKTDIYIDFDRIRKHNGKYFWWTLINLNQIRKDGFKSFKGYREGDCNLFRMRTLSVVSHFKSMGEDIGESNNTIKPEWIYPEPNTIDELLLNKVCNY